MVLNGGDGDCGSGNELKMIGNLRCVMCGERVRSCAASFAKGFSFGRLLDAV